MRNRVIGLRDDGACFAKERLAGRRKMDLPFVALEKRNAYMWLRLDRADNVGTRKSALPYTSQESKSR